MAITRSKMPSSLLSVVLARLVVLVTSDPSLEMADTCCSACCDGEGMVVVMSWCERRMVLMRAIQMGHFEVKNLLMEGVLSDRLCSMKEVMARESEVELVAA